MELPFVVIAILASFVGGIAGGLVCQSFHKIEIKYIKDTIDNHFNYIGEAWENCIKMTYENKRKELDLLFKKD